MKVEAKDRPGRPDTGRTVSRGQQNLAQVFGVRPAGLVFGDELNPARRRDSETELDGGQHHAGLSPAFPPCQAAAGH